jgi:methyl-accepting chemotaxis protein
MSASIAVRKPESSPRVERDGSVLSHTLFPKLMTGAMVIGTIDADLADHAVDLEASLPTLHDLVSATDQVAGSSAMLHDQLRSMSERANEIGRNAVMLATAMAADVDDANETIAELAQTANDFEGEAAAAAAQMAELGKSLSGIQNIAREIQLLAVNAGVEAARHGTSGRGFAVIAEAVKKLADQTRTSTETTGRHLSGLIAAMQTVQAKGRVNLTKVVASGKRAATAAAGVDTLKAACGAIAEVSEELARCIPGATVSAEVCGIVRDGVASTTQRIEQASRGVGEVSRLMPGVARSMSGLCGLVAEHSEDLPISDLIHTCRETAGRVSDLLERAIRAGEIRQDQVFDEHYRPVPGTDPQQFLTDLIPLVDRLLSPLQEAMLQADRRIVHCMAIDRNGYVPMFNRRPALASSDHPAWTSAHIRQRRIFGDPESLAAARNRNPILLQTCRHETGGGVMALIVELASPIIVNGRHWGGFRLGFDPATRDRP